MAGIEYSRTVVCGCGNPLKVFASSGRTQIMCRACRLKRKPTPTSCGNCGKPLSKTSSHQKFCGFDCCQAHHARLRRKRPPGYRGIEPVLCEGCGKQFKSHKRKESRYCSRPCGVRQHTGLAQSAGASSAAQQASPLQRMWLSCEAYAQVVRCLQGTHCVREEVERDCRKSDPHGLVRQMLHAICSHEEESTLLL